VCGLIFLLFQVESASCGSKFLDAGFYSGKWHELFKSWSWPEPSSGNNRKKSEKNHRKSHSLKTTVGRHPKKRLTKDRQKRGQTNKTDWVIHKLILITWCCFWVIKSKLNNILFKGSNGILQRDTFWFLLIGSIFQIWKDAFMLLPYIFFLRSSGLMFLKCQQHKHFIISKAKCN